MHKMWMIFLTSILAVFGGCVTSQPTTPPPIPCRSMVAVAAGEMLMNNFFPSQSFLIDDEESRSIAFAAERDVQFLYLIKKGALTRPEFPTSPIGQCVLLIRDVPTAFEASLSIVLKDFLTQRPGAQ